MSKEDIEALRIEFEVLNLKIEKPKFHKIIRQPGRERLLFVQQCLSQLYGDGQQHCAFTPAYGLEEQKELEEEIVKQISSYGICNERRIIIGNGSDRENLLFWKKLLELIEAYHSCKNKKNINTEYRKAWCFITELLQQPDLQKLLQPKEIEQPIDFTPENSFSEVDLLQIEKCDIHSDFCKIEHFVPPSLEEHEQNRSSMCQRLKENTQLLQERVAEFKRASKNFPKLQIAPCPNLMGLGEAIEQQCTPLQQIRNFVYNTEEIENSVDFLTSIEPPDVSATESENLFSSSSAPDLLNGLH